MRFRSEGSTAVIGVIDAARRSLGLTVADLWWRYFALGGMRTLLEIDGILHHALVPSEFDCDVLAVALNERMCESGGDHVIPYSDDVGSRDPDVSLTMFPVQTAPPDGRVDT